MPTLVFVTLAETLISTTKTTFLLEHLLLKLEKEIFSNLHKSSFEVFHLCCGKLSQSTHHTKLIYSSIYIYQVLDVYRFCFKHLLAIIILFDIVCFVGARALHCPRFNP